MIKYSFIKNHNTLFSNFSYMAVLQVFMMVSQLITYPYLVSVLGRELFGVVLTAQVLASYVTLVVGFGSDNVCAKFVAQYRNDSEKLSEILCSVLSLRFFIWIICFAAYLAIVYIIPVYRNYMVLFVLTYGLSLQKMLLPQFFFQGLEKMKITSYLNVGSSLFFLCLIFVLVQEKSDYLLVPVLYTFGYLFGGLASLYIIFKGMKIRFSIPSMSTMYFYFRESLPIFATDIISTIKDKFNVLFLGSFAGMSNVVIYDLATKICSLQHLPTSIICTVTLPRTSIGKDYSKLRKLLLLVLALCASICVIVNVFLPYIVNYFLHEEIDLTPIRIYTLSPFFLSVSVIIGVNFFIGFGYTKYNLYSIIITTISYILAVAFFYFTDNFDSVYSFILISLFSYFIEMLYKFSTFLKLEQKDKNQSK